MRNKSMSKMPFIVIAMIMMVVSGTLCAQERWGSYDIGMQERKNKNYAQAANLFEKSLKKDRVSSARKAQHRTLCNIYLADCYANLERYDAAYARIEKAFAEYGDKGKALGLEQTDMFILYAVRGYVGHILNKPGYCEDYIRARMYVGTYMRDVFCTVCLCINKEQLSYLVALIGKPIEVAPSILGEVSRTFVNSRGNEHYVFRRGAYGAFGAESEGGRIASTAFMSEAAGSMETYSLLSAVENFARDEGFVALERSKTQGKYIHSKLGYIMRVTIIPSKLISGYSNVSLDLFAN